MHNVIQCKLSGSSRKIDILRTHILEKRYSKLVLS
ncbi:unnamed protein product [Musa acuminata subsp. burmannicoides]